MVRNNTVKYYGKIWLTEWNCVTLNLGKTLCRDMWLSALGRDYSCGFILYSDLLEIIHKILKEKLDSSYYSVPEQNSYFY